MPELRTIEGRERFAMPTASTFEPGHETARRRRARRGSYGTVPVEVRNGLPVFRPYVYRGLGYDQLTGDHDA